MTSFEQALYKHCKDFNVYNRKLSSLPSSGIANTKKKKESNVQHCKNIKYFLYFIVDICRELSDLLIIHKDGPLKMYAISILTKLVFVLLEYLGKILIPPYKGQYKKQT